MNLTRLAFLVLAGCCLLLTPLRAQIPASWAPDKQFSADQIITTKDGMTIDSKVYVDTGKIRTEMDGHGMNMVSIALLDQKKIYMVMVEQKMVMEMPLSDARAKMATAASGGDNGAKFVVVGPDTVDGVPCTKYKMTSDKDPKVFYWWISSVTKTPAKLAADDGSFTLLWKNYKAGPQDPSLFQPPSDYQVMQMPAGMGMPGGGAPSASQQ